MTVTAEPNQATSELAADLREELLDDPARGRRLVWRDAAGVPVRVALADGTNLGITRDDDAGSIAVSDAGGPLLTLRAPVAIPALVRALGLTPGQAAGIDGVHRLIATDPAGETTTESREHSVRLERAGQVLRIDTDDDGRPRRVTAPGFADLVYQWAQGQWLVSRLGGPTLLRITESPEGDTFVPAGAGAPQGWREVLADGAVNWTDLSGSPIAGTRLDGSGRVIQRWHGPRQLDYERDDQARLARWQEQSPGQRVRVTQRQYQGGEWAGLVTAAGRTVVRTDAGGRVRKLISPQGTTTFDYDANGRRTGRTGSDGHATRYRYDPLGQLVEVVKAEHVVGYGWDGLGRRVTVTIDGQEYREHRDPAGRLWSVTTAGGAPICAFIWWAGRVVARCDAAGGIAETYLTDPFGTLVAVASQETGGRFADAIQPPFGQVAAGAGWRPTLFGHIADGVSGLIPFGARDLDPETGSFLTPDPWHGGADDPRRLAGQAAGELPTETPRAGIHAYALSQYDPLSRPDHDGHFGVFNFILTLILGPTWGAALTSLSIFLFTPLNLYMEVIGLLGYFGGGHFWPQHSIFQLRGVSGSSRLGTMALALNGFFPRATAGVSGDRCITIGHVVWENRHYFRMLDRARVLELDDISGTPVAVTGLPSLDPRRFADARAASILAVISTDADRRKWVHGTWWTRGPGNAVGLRGPDQTFEDRVAAGTAHARGTVYLAQPMPRVMPAPQSESDKGSLEVVQYTITGGPVSDAELVTDTWFAFEVAAAAGIAANTVLGITAGTTPAAFGAVQSVVPGKKPVAILDHVLPNRFQTANARSVQLQKFIAAAATSANWAFRAGVVDKKKIELAAPGHSVAVGDMYKAAPTVPDPATPERHDAYTAVEKVTLAVTVTPTLGAAIVGGSTLLRLTPDGKAANGNYPDPAAHPDQVTFPKDQPFAVDDLVQVTAGAVTRFGIVSAVAAAVPAGPPGAAGAPGTPPVPASITLDEPLTGLPAGVVKVARLKPSNKEKDKGDNIAQAGDVLTVEVTSTALFAASQLVLVDGAPKRVRQVSAVGLVGVDLVDELVGTGPFTLTKFTESGTKISSKVSAGRFVKHTGGDLPSTYGDWPAAIMGLVPTAYSVERAPGGWRYFLKINPPPADMHPDFSDYWQPVTVGGSSYWLLTSELKITKDGGTFYWEPDPEDDHPRRHQQEIAPTGAAGGFPLKVRGFARTAVIRPDVAGSGKVFAFPAEVQVPEEPTVRWSLADGLADHELTHTLQNTYWGPILGALPLQGAFSAVRDILTAAGVERKDVKWMDYSPFADAGAQGFGDSNLFEIASIGGLMQIIWSFVILGPALLDDDARKKILSTNFADWSAVWNPVNQLIIDAIPPVQPDVDSSHDWKVVLGRALTRALDLKAWTPFMGFIKLLLPDGPRNFLEQQASRKSGDTYSTILSVDDKFNAKLALVADKKDANITAPLGDAVRLMSYYQYWYSRNLRLDACDAPGSALRMHLDFSSGAIDDDILTFSPVIPPAVPPAAGALLPADLYEPAAGVAPPVIQVDGPPPAGGGAAPVTKLWQVPNGMKMRPKLRALVPIPPRVWRAVGCYLIPAGPAVWAASAPEVDPGAATNEATITVESKVLLGADDVPWTLPAITGAAPAGPGIPRFITEKQTLTVNLRDTTGWQAVAGAGITLTARAGGNGWDLTVNPPAGGVALPTDVRVRIWAPVRPGDKSLFDLEHRDIATLVGKRAYFEDEFWIPVRDFLIAVTDLPALPQGGVAASMTANGNFDLDLPIKVAGPASIVAAGPLLKFSREKDVPPRGERWRFTAAADRFVEAAQVVHVVVTFAPGVTRAFDLTVKPNFTLDAAKFEVTAANQLDLTVNGGSAPFTVVDQPPANSRARAVVAGNTVNVKIAPAPPIPPGGVAPPAIPPINWRIKVRDSTGAIGVRSLVLKP